MRIDAASRPSRPRLAGLLLALAALAGGCSSPGNDLELQRARNAVFQDRHDWARIHYERDLATHPERVESLRGLGVAWLSGYQRSLSSGIDAYRRYLARHPDDAEIRQRLVGALLLAGEWDAARAELGSLDDSPRSHLLRARALLDTSPAEAQRFVEGALEVAEPSAEAHAVAAQVLERLEEPEAALSHALDALRLDPLDYETHYLAARLRARSGDAAGSEEQLFLYRLASRVRHDGTMEPLVPAAELEVLGELAAAMETEGSASFRRRRAETAFRAGRADDALADVEWLRARVGVTASELLELAGWADTKGRRALAADLLEQAARLAPDDRGVLSSLAILDLRSGELEAARARLARCLEVDPALARCHLLSARLELAGGDEAAALDRFGRALELAPWEAGWRAEWAEALWASGRRNAFRRALETAPEASPELERLAGRLR